MDKKAGFEGGGEENPDISWIDGKDNGDETQYFWWWIWSYLVRIDLVPIMEELVQQEEKVLTWEFLLGVGDSGCGEFSFGDEEFDC